METGAAEGLYPFVGVPTFLRAPLAGSAEGSDFAVLGVPIDEGSPFMPGSRFGPRAIREQSMRFASAPDSRFDARAGRRLLDLDADGQQLVDVGDVGVVPAAPASTAASTTAAVRDIAAADAVPVVLGGDHSITHPVVMGLEGPLHVVQFDAHLDYAVPRGPHRYTNAHAFRQISHMESVAGLVQVGIRSLRTEAGLYRDSLADGNRIVPPDELRALGPGGLAALLPEQARCYVSVDVDALDMPLVPGCVSAEPGGLTYAELRDALVAIAGRAHVVGIDLVEVNPSVDTPAGATAYLAAHLLVEALDAIARARLPA